MDLGSLMSRVEGGRPRHTRRVPARGRTSENRLRHLILIGHPGPRVGDVLQPMPVRRGGGKGGQAAQVRQSGAEVGRAELGLLRHGLIPVGAEVRPREASRRGSGEWSGPGVARWGGTRVSTTAGVVAARWRGSGVLTGPVSRDSRKFVQLGFMLFAVGPLIVPPAEEEEDQEDADDCNT